MAKAMLTNKYENTVFSHPGCDKKTFYMSKEDIVFILQKKDGGCMIFAVYNEEDVEDENVTSFLAILLIQEEQQSEVVLVEMPEPGCKEEKVWVTNNDY